MILNKIRKLVGRLIPRAAVKKVRPAVNVYQYCSTNENEIEFWQSKIIPHPQQVVVVAGIEFIYVKNVQQQVHHLRRCQRNIALKVSSCKNGGGLQFSFYWAGAVESFEEYVQIKEDVVVVRMDSSVELEGEDLETQKQTVTLTQDEIETSVQDSIENPPPIHDVQQVQDEEVSQQLSKEDEPVEKVPDFLGAIKMFDKSKLQQRESQQPTKKSSNILLDSIQTFNRNNLKQYKQDADENNKNKKQEGFVNVVAAQMLERARNKNIIYDEIEQDLSEWS